MPTPTPHWDIRIVNSTSNGFSPKNVTIQPGDRLVWWNSTTADHTVTSTDGSGELPLDHIDGGDTYGHTFQSAGFYTYHCDIHHSMTGTITVQ